MTREIGLQLNNAKTEIRLLNKEFRGLKVAFYASVILNLTLIIKVGL
jgi:hypothetical protein|tara:strand:- start:183 stop:323 length:141 start_codon:yes stop_codon:yes gene_type:complete